MKKVAIVGASGYAGCELVNLLLKHKNVILNELYVSKDSQDKGQEISSLYGNLYKRCNLKLLPLDDNGLKNLIKNDIVFLATEHKVSHDLAKYLYDNNVHIFDLSGAFRVEDALFYEKYYGFKHENLNLLKEAVYGLCEWCDKEKLQKSRLISLPGCYPTASQLALKPLIENKLLDSNFKAIINAVSGVTGAGRKAKLSNSFCEVSLNAYNLFCHRHTPEIASHLNFEVIFNAHLGAFKRGIHATISAKLKEGVTDADIQKAFSYYENQPLVRVKDSLPKLSDVVNTPYCDISYRVADGYIVICSCIDNLLKGASAQAVQAMNLHFAFDEFEALL